MLNLLKDRTNFILSVVAFFFFITAVGSCLNAGRFKGVRDTEMSKRIDAEEKLSKFSRDRAALEQKIKALEKELEEEKAARQATERAVAQERLIGESLKDELAKTAKAKEALEEQLKSSSKSKNRR